MSRRGSVVGFTPLADASAKSDRRTGEQRAAMLVSGTHRPAGAISAVGVFIGGFIGVFRACTLSGRTQEFVA